MRGICARSCLSDRGVPACAGPGCGPSPLPSVPGSTGLRSCGRPVLACRQGRCDTGCVHPTSRPGRIRQMARVVGVAVPGGLGVLFVGALTAVPGPTRERRGAWALHHAVRWALRSIGIRIVVQGPPRSGPTLVVSNQTSWLDVLVLASAAPMIMVAKSEVADWPLIGRAGVWAGTVLVHRDELRTLPDAVAQITAILRSGARVQVFPEGTNRCGGAWAIPSSSVPGRDRRHGGHLTIS